MSTDAVTRSPETVSFARRAAFIALRLLVAGAIVAALVVTFSSSSAAWNTAGYPDRATLITNFWSFFTVESNAGAAVVLTIGAILLLTSKNPAVADPRWYNLLRACIATYMTITGIVYNLLLRGVAVSGAAEDPHPWTNEVLHVIGPIYLVLDWVLAPGRRPVPWKRIAVILALPLAWTVYTLLRGPLVFDQVRERETWYPYPFLDPSLSANGYLSVGFYVIMITILFGVVGSLVVWVSRRGIPRSNSGILAE